MARSLVEIINTDSVKYAVMMFMFMFIYLYSTVIYTRYSMVLSESARVARIYTYLNAKLKKCVFNLVLNVFVSPALRTSKGSAFHSFGAAAWNERSWESCALLKEQQVLDLCEIVGNIVHHRQITYLICTEALGHAALWKLRNIFCT